MVLTKIRHFSFNFAKVLRRAHVLFSINFLPSTFCLLAGKMSQEESPANTSGLPAPGSSTTSTRTSPTTPAPTDEPARPPALPPRPANLPLPSSNGLPHPPHAFNGRSGKNMTKCNTHASEGGWVVLIAVD